MKRNLMKKNKWTDVVRSAVGIVIFACLFAIAFTSCKEEEESVNDLSQIIVKDLSYDCYQSGAKVESISGKISGNKLYLKVYDFVVATNSEFETVKFSYAIYDNTIRIYVSPNDHLIDESLSWRGTTIDFSCTICNIPSNMVFYVELSERGHSSVYEFSTR